MLGTILPGQGKSRITQVSGNNHACPIGQRQLYMKKACNPASQDKNTFSRLDTCSLLATKNTG
jgi:hypothetical protein